MSISAPMRRFAPRCLHPPTLTLAHRPANSQRRSASSSSSGDNTSSNPILEAFQRENPGPSNPTQAQQSNIAPRAGDLSASSIFEDDRRTRAAREAQSQPPPESSEQSRSPAARDPRNSLRALDPDPNARERWERKKVIQSIRRGGRLSREEFLARTERQWSGKSEEMKTSIKKLGMLARQVAGKGVEEAITQMRFSRKKVAGDVLRALEAARDSAVVERGMGLGQVVAEGGAADAPVVGGGATDPQPPATAQSSKKGKGLDIELKDGTRHTVTDSSKIYIDQAWVGRGKYGKQPDFRARGRVFIMRTPWTTISVVLKEEATRVREWREKEERRAKLRRERVWRQMPDRPVHGRGQMYSW